jgi:tetratricopeptide (TPR) repeat protein
MNTRDSEDFLRRLVPKAPLAVFSMIAFGLIAILVFALQFELRQIALIISVGFMAAGAALLLGALLGFLFGIPRTLQTSKEISEGAVDRVAPTKPFDNLPQYQPNTNLEQISDWLTKILIGIGLANLSQIGGGLIEIGNLIKPGLGNQDTSLSFAVGLLLYYLVTGFILGYLWTRLSLAGTFRLADIYSSRREKREIEKMLQMDDTISEEEAVLRDESIDTENKEIVIALDSRIRTLEFSGEALNPEAYRSLARQLKSVGEYEEAERAYLRAFALQPTDPAPLNFAGAIRSKFLKDYKGAEELYRKALSVDPNYISAIYNMACNEARRANNSAALNLLAVAIASDPKYIKLAEGDTESGGPFERLKTDPKFKALIESSSK